MLAQSETLHQLRQRQGALQLSGVEITHLASAPVRSPESAGV
jgi:hypothetical protein